MGETADGFDRPTQPQSDGGENTVRARLARAISGRATAATGGGGGEEAEEIEVGSRPSIQAGEQRLGTPAKRAGRKPTARASITQTEAKDSATDLVEMLNDAARFLIGDSAVMEKREEAAITRRLTRVGKRNPEIVDALNRWGDPFALVLALSIWAFRLWIQLRTEQAKAAQMMAQYQGAPHAPDIQTIADLPPAPEPQAKPRVSVRDLQNITRLG